MKKETIAKKIRDKLLYFYCAADKYAQGLDLHDESAFVEYIEFVKRFVIPNSLILDVGCGTGLSSFLLVKEGYKSVGMDISQICIEKASAREQNNLRFVCGDILDLPFKNGRFDCVSIFVTIEHVPDIPRAINEMLRVTKQKGKIIILSPNLLSPFNILLPLFDSLLGKKADFLFGVSNFWKAAILLIKNAVLLLKKEFSQTASFNYREPILENRIDFIPDNDAVYLACPVDFKRYFQGLKNIKITNYQGYGRIGKILPDFSTGIYITVTKL